MKLFHIHNEKVSMPRTSSYAELEVGNRCYEFLSQVGTLDDGIWEKLAFRLLNISYIRVHVRIYVCIHMCMYTQV